MFQLDNKFLEDIGLGSLPEEQKQALLQHTLEELETRVGARLSEGLTPDQVDEFEAIIEKRTDVVDQWLANHAPDWQEDPVFVRLKQAVAASGQAVSDDALRMEFAATKWLEVNRPDYRQVVATVLNDLKQEMANNRDAILGAQ